MNSISVGKNTNVQDGAIVHVARHSLGEPTATVIGDNVTIGGPPVADDASASAPPSAGRRAACGAISDAGGRGFLKCLLLPAATRAAS